MQGTKKQFDKAYALDYYGCNCKSCMENAYEDFNGDMLQQTDSYDDAYHGWTLAFKTIRAKGKKQ